MSCHERFYKKLRITVEIKGLSLDECAALKEWLDELRENEKNRDIQSKIKG